MRKGLWMVGGIVLVLALGAGKAWSASQVKIGYIDLQRIIEVSDKGKELRERLFKLRQEKERILAAKQEELNAMRKDFEQKAFTLSDRARLDKQQEIRQKELEFRNLSEAYRQEVLMEGRKLQALMFRELSDVVKRIGKREGFTIILDKDVILYADEAINITDKVIQEYNAQARKSGS